MEVIGNFRRNGFKGSVDKVRMQVPIIGNKEAVRHVFYVCNISIQKTEARNLLD